MQRFPEKAKKGKGNKRVGNPARPYAFGFRNRFLVMIEWAWAYLRFGRSARLITGASRRPSS
jgi:hypothetical protein